MYQVERARYKKQAYIVVQLFPVSEDKAGVVTRPDLADQIRKGGL